MTNKNTQTIESQGTTFGFDSVAVDNSAKIGVQDTALQGIIGTMGALVSDLSDKQLNTIQKLSATTAGTAFNWESYKPYIIMAGVLLGAYFLKKSIKKRRK